MNPNNCETCKHKQNPDGGWCYMFEHEPSFVCRQHTEREARISIAELAEAMLKGIKVTTK